jgi:hypothetical protein
MPNRPWLNTNPPPNVLCPDRFNWPIPVLVSDAAPEIAPENVVLSPEPRMAVVTVRLAARYIVPLNVRLLAPMVSKSPLAVIAFATDCGPPFTASKNVPNG